MKVTHLIIVLFFLFGGLTGAGGFVSAEEPEISPDWSHTTVSGSEFRLGEQVARRPVVVLFWATWCPYCKALMPHLQSIKLEYGDRLDIVAVHFRADKSDPESFINKAGYDFVLLPNGEPIAEIYGIWGTPGILIVDGARNIRFDLRSLDVPTDLVRSDQKHTQKANRLAPYWAAEIRRHLDQIVR